MVSNRIEKRQKNEVEREINVRIGRILWTRIPWRII